MSQLQIQKFKLYFIEKKEITIKTPLNYNNHSHDLKSILRINILNIH